MDAAGCFPNNASALPGVFGETKILQLYPAVDANRKVHLQSHISCLKCLALNEWKRMREPIHNV